MPPTDDPSVREPRRLLPLGTGSILMGAGRSAAGYLLEIGGLRLLVDIGPGTLLRLSQAGIVGDSIDAVLLSHFHPDHHADLLGLLFLRQNPELAGRLRPLRLLGPPGLRKILAAWKSIYGKWIDHPDEDVEEIGSEPVTVGPVRVRPFPARHSLPAFCYRFEVSDGTILAYSGDTEEGDGLVAACAQADLCWLECSFPDEAAAPGHLTPAGVRRVLEAAAPRVAGLTHFYPPMEAVLTDRERWAEQWQGLATEVRALRDLEEVRF